MIAIRTSGHTGSFNARWIAADFGSKGKAMTSAATKENKIATYAEFWPFYLKEHRNPMTRHLHYFGSSLGIATVIAAIATQTWWLLVVALVSGYLFAWIGHFFVEKNRPATFTYPLWSLISDFRMFWRWATGRLPSDFKRFNIPQ